MVEESRVFKVLPPVELFVCHQNSLKCVCFKHISDVKTIPFLSNWKAHLRTYIRGVCVLGFFKYFNTSISKQYFFSNLFSHYFRRFSLFRISKVEIFKKPSNTNTSSYIQILKTQNYKEIPKCYIKKYKNE